MIKKLKFSILAIKQGENIIKTLPRLQKVHYLCSAPQLSQVTKHDAVSVTRKSAEISPELFNYPATLTTITLWFQTTCCYWLEPQQDEGQFYHICSQQLF